MLGGHKAWGWWRWHSNHEPTQVTISLGFFFWEVGGIVTYELYAFFTPSPSEYGGGPEGHHASLTKRKLN